MNYLYGVFTLCKTEPRTVSFVREETAERAVGEALGQLLRKDALSALEYQVTVCRVYEKPPSREEVLTLRTGRMWFDGCDWHIELAPLV